MSEQQRRRLVDDLERASAVKTREIRDAFLAVPREIFISKVVEEKGVEAAYLDEAYPTKTDDRGDAISSSSQPQIMALMLEALRVQPGHRVLEVGTGTGYNAALLSLLVGREGHVTSVELDPDLATEAERNIRHAGREVHVVVGDGRQGFPAQAPYDRIIVTASSLDVPHAFLEQLKDGGLLVIPIRITDSLPFQQLVVAFRRRGDRFGSDSVLRGGFMRLRVHPADESLPWPSAPITAESGVVLGWLTGAALDGLSDDVLGRLAALFVHPPRAIPLPVRLRSWQQWELQTFIAMSLDDEVLAGVALDALGDLSWLGTALPAVIDRNGRGLAHLAGRSTISRIDAYGGPGPDRTLADVIDDWRDRRRPSVSDLLVSVTYGEGPLRSWRTKHRDTSRIAFDW